MSVAFVGVCALIGICSGVLVVSFFGNRFQIR